MSIQDLNRQMDRWWDQQFASGEIDIKRTADIGVEEFANDPEFCREYTRYFIRTALYQRGIDLASRRRSMIREEGKAIAKAKPVRSYTFDPIVPPAPRRIETDEVREVIPARPTSPPMVALRPAVQQPVAKVTRSWTEWLERDPETGHHVSVVTFTKPKLIKKAQEIEERLGRDAHLASFFRLAAGRLPDSTTSLGDVLSEDDLNNLIGNIEGKLTVSIGLNGVPGKFTWEKLLT